jgi:hypothetical protein
VAKLVAHNLRRHHSAERLGQKVNNVHQDQIVRRPGVRDDQHAPSKTKLVEYPALALQIGEVVRFVNPMRL